MYSTTGVVDSPANLLAALDSAAAALVGLPVPDSGVVAMAEADRLLRASDLVRLAVDQRIGVVDRLGEAKAAGFSSTSAWLRTGGRMNASTASMHRRNGRGFNRLAATVDAVAAGTISYAMATAIVAATEVLTDDTDAQVGEEILLNLATDPTSTVEKVARAGRYLRQVLDPDGHLDDEEKAHRKRFMTAHREPDGGIAGSYYLPPEAAARLQALFDAYGRKQGSDDDRTTSVRNADVLIQLLVNAVTAELLILVNAETLTDEEQADTETGDPQAGDPQTADPQTADPQTADPQTADPQTAGDDRTTDQSDSPHDSAPDHSTPDHSGDGPSAQIITWPTRPPHHSWNSDGRERTSPTSDGCPTCGRRTNRDVPGLLLSTGHPLPAPHVRRLARTSRLMRIVLEAPGMVLDLGSTVRLVPPRMRKAILATYDTCAYDSCPVPATWCEMDHIHPWATHHSTRLDDIAPACDQHNRDRAKHPHNYKAERQTDGRWHITSITRRFRT